MIRFCRALLSCAVGGVLLASASSASATPLDAPGAPSTAALASRPIADLGVLGGTASEATGVNESGVVVGVTTTAAGEAHAFRWTRTETMVDLGVLGRVNGTGFSSATAINDAGEVVGTSTTTNALHAFRWAAGEGMRDLGVLADQAPQIFGGRAITQTGMGRLVERYARTYKFASILGGSEDVLATQGIKMALREFPGGAKL